VFYMKHLTFKECKVPEYHDMKAYWVSGGVDPRILTSSRDGGE